MGGLSSNMTVSSRAGAQGPRDGDLSSLRCDGTFSETPLLRVNSDHEEFIPIDFQSSLDQVYNEDLPVGEAAEDSDFNLIDLVRYSPTEPDCVVDSVVDKQDDVPSSSSLRVVLPDSTLLIPRSCFVPFDPGFPTVSERVALTMLGNESNKAAETSGFTEYQLNEFAIYCDSVSTPLEMKPLHQLDTKIRHSNFFFDGTLSANSTTVYVRRVPILALPIGNYGSVSDHTTRNHIWITSELTRSRGVFYKLHQPAREYARFYKPFLWVADLAKHFVDFLMLMGRHKRSVTLHHFRSTFATCLKKLHTNAPEFDQWISQHSSTDFCTSIIANISFLHKEAVGVLGHRSALQHGIWSETLDFKRYKPLPKPATDPHYTIVTQYIFNTFHHLPFGDRLQPVNLDIEAQRLRDGVIRKWQLFKPSATNKGPFTRSLKHQIRQIQPGDTISTPRDTTTSGTLWRREVPAGFDDVDRWFALVLKVHISSGEKRVFDVIWYYRPMDTLCGLMKYPWHNELFLSDHCSCRDRPKISEDEILGLHSVDFGGSPSTEAEFFCRQVYLSSERSWVTLDAAHLSCHHSQPRASQKYYTGDTVLVHIDTSSTVSEPCEVVCSFKENDRRFYRLRRLLRRQASDPTARPNQLVYTNQLIEASRMRILGTCSIRFYKPTEEVPVPYNRDGVGGFFYITHQEILRDDGPPEYVPLGDFPSFLRQGFDPNSGSPQTSKLRGLDLFCGGGNFGRGLEDGGGIEMRWANDYDVTALHTYMANVQDQSLLVPFLGSIDEMQLLATEAKFSKSVPPIGDVDFISAGSPCPGFSRITNDKTTLNQRKNQSLVAAFASFVDLYRPKYALLENVPGIVQQESNRDQDVFSQLICAIVGLGYQARFFFLDASSCGSPQRRSRVFLMIAAPGCKLPDKPQQTHSHPPFTRGMGLGKLPTRKAMAEREMPRATPFKFVSAEEATADLPCLYDAKPDICVPFPDHRLSIGLSKTLRTRMALIPTRPYAMNFAQAWYGPDKKQAGSGTLTPSEREIFPTESNALSMRAISGAYGRQHPHRLLETVTTRMHPGDAKCGRVMHWHEPRVLSIMEARRAQGFRDEEVVLGLPAQQFKIIGNSVARGVAVALGAAIQAAWAQSQPIRHDEKMKVEESPLLEGELGMIIDDLSSSTESDWPISLKSPPDTSATEISPSPQRGLSPAGTKRRARSSISVDIYVSKSLKTEGATSPRTEVKGLLVGNHEGLQPSPLGQAMEIPPMNYT